MPFLPIDIVAKISPRATSFEYQDVATCYQSVSGFNDLLTISSQEQSETKELPENRDIIARQWWANAVGYETRGAIKKQQSAQEKKLRYQQEIARKKIVQLQQETDEQYQDRYNRLICQKGDQLKTTDLKKVGEEVMLDLIQSTTDQEIIDMISTREVARQQQRITQLLNTGLSLMKNIDKALSFALLNYEIDRRKTDETWGRPLQEAIANGILGEPIILMTMLCTINEFDYKGGYNLNPNLDTYKTNQKVEPVPIIIDEMAQIVKLFKNYGIQCELYMFVADTDYTEIGANGAITQSNLNNLETYMQNLRQYTGKLNIPITVAEISEITNQDKVYQTTKQKVLNWVTAKRDSNFNYLWGNKFEEDVEKRNETFGKKKLCPPDQVRQESLRVAQNIWAVNAAQGAVFADLGQNVIFLSTERRDRDANYTVGLDNPKQFPPTIYILKAAENWNRKITNKSIYEIN